MPEVWRASGGGAGQKEMKLRPLRVCFCWAVPALILTQYQCIGKKMSLFEQISRPIGSRARLQPPSIELRKTSYQYSTVELAGRTTSVMAPPPPDSPGRRSRKFSSTPRTPSV